MKKIVIIFVIAVLGITAAFGGLGAAAIYRAAQEEIRTVQSLAGAVVSADPQMEQVFVEALLEEDGRAEADGAEILGHYGYRSDMAVKQQDRKMLLLYFFVLALLLCILLAYGYGMWSFFTRKQKRQGEYLLSILEECLRGDYHFTGEEKALEKLEDPRFADSLIKLAECLQLRTSRLNEERDQTKTLVTDISHQLKTPISAMKVCFSMYEEAGSEAEKAEFFQRSRAQLEKLDALAAALVNISRLEKGMIELHRESLSLRDLLIGAVNTVYHKAFARHMELVTQDFEDVALRLDRKWTTEAIANVLDNAVKYSPEGSCIQIRVQKRYSFVRIEIEDQGIGIADWERNRIFQRFYRGSGDVVSREEGAGVGLYLSRKILEEQGGVISVRAARKTGSVFLLQLPL